MPLEEYADLEYVQEMELQRYMYAICKAKVDGGYSGFSRERVANYFERDAKNSANSFKGGAKNSVYFNKLALESKAEQSIAEQSKAKQSKAKQRRICKVKSFVGRMLEQIKQKVCICS